MDNDSFENLVSQWNTLKSSEQRLYDERVMVEQKLLQLVDVKEEGSVTTERDGWKVTVISRINRTLDVDRWEEVKLSIPEKFWPVTYKPTIDVKGLRWLEYNDPVYFAQASKAITARPGKPTVSISQKVED